MAENSIRVIDIDGHVRKRTIFGTLSRTAFAPARRNPTGAQRPTPISARGQPPPPQTRRVSFQVKPDDSPVNEHRDLATDPRERLKDMDRDGIERGMLFPSAGLYLTSVEEEAYAGGACRAYNSWLYDYCSADRKRLMGVGVIRFKMFKRRSRKRARFSS